MAKKPYIRRAKDERIYWAADDYIRHMEQLRLDIIGQLVATLNLRPETVEAYFDDYVAERQADA